MAAEQKIEENRAQMEQSTQEQKQSVTEKAVEIENSKVEEGKKMEEDKKMKEIDVVEEKKIEIGEKEEISSNSPTMGIQEESEKESDLLSDLKDHEKKALSDLRSKVEEAILNNMIFEQKKEEKPVEEKQRVTENEQKEKSIENTTKEDAEGTEKEAATTSPTEETVKEVAENEGKEEIITENNNKILEKAVQEQAVDKEIAIWGVPLLPSKGDNRTDIVLLKFLRAREFKVTESFEMLKNTLKWRKENKIDSILEEDLEADLGSMAYIGGNDRNGHPICYNIFAVLGNDELYGKAFEEKREKFMRSRIQLMEKTIQKMDFNPGGASATLQINDLKNTPLPTKKELRMATKRAVDLLQDNYPEFVSKNIFINVPLWYYAYFALFSPSLSQRAKNKIIYARPARVTDTLLKYISPSHIPVQYGGLQRDNDTDFSVEDDTKEAIVKAGSEETIEIDAPEAGKTLIWDVTVSGWEVNYKEEFIPTDEGSYTIIVQKSKRIAVQEGTIRNNFTNKEPGKIVITIENGAFKKKRVLYRYKIKNSASSS